MIQGTREIDVGAVITMMKTIVLRGMFVVLFFASLVPASSFGEILTIKHTVKQTFGGGQSPDDARISGIALAKREALEKAGTYIESLTVVQNSKVEKDEILALAAGVLKAEVMSQKNYASDDAFGIEIVVNIVVDTSLLEERVKKQLQDRTHLTQLKDTQKREKELLQKVAKLEEENRRLSTKKQTIKKLKKEFQQVSQGLTAVDWFYKADALWDGKKYTDPKKAIEYLNNIIKLQPEAYIYAIRGLIYAAELKQYQRAIEDFNDAIRLKPDLAEAYYGRGSAYDDLGQQQRAIEDYNVAIRLQPDYYKAFYNRGLDYGGLGQYQNAIEDYNEAIRLKPDLSEAYVNRGDTYNSLGQYQLAIESLNEAILLKPDDAYAYHNLGRTYFIQGNNNLGCLNAQKACELGNCKLSEWANGEGRCNNAESAQSEFSGMLDKGQGISYKDLMLKLGAEAGDSNAQYELAERYIRGVGVEKNRHLAEKWLVLSILNDPKNKKSMALIEKEFNWHCVDGDWCISIINNKSIIHDKNLSWYWEIGLIKVELNKEVIRGINRRYYVMNCNNRTLGFKTFQVLDDDLHVVSKKDYTFEDNKIKFKPLEPGTYSDKLFNYVCGQTNDDKKAAKK
jgi:tetratricopeptide (TPR) repeat protein